MCLLAGDRGGVVPSNGLCLIQSPGWRLTGGSGGGTRNFRSFCRMVGTRLGKQRLLSSMKVDVRDQEFIDASENFYYHKVLSCFLFCFVFK